MSDGHHIGREKRRTIAADSSNAAYCEECGFLAIGDGEVEAEQYLKTHTHRKVTTDV